MEVAARIAQGPAPALGVAKGLVNQAAGVDRLDFHLDQELAPPLPGLPTPPISPKGLPRSSRSVLPAFLRLRKMRRG